jgi:hypothetical protein
MPHVDNRLIIKWVLEKLGSEDTNYIRLEYTGSGYNTMTDFCDCCDERSADFKAD